AIGTNLDRLVKKEKLTARERDEALARITTTTQLASLADVDLVIEAATENEALKLKLLRDVDAVMNHGAILASNTSSLSITKLAAAVSQPDKFIGMHFFNPVPVMG